MIQKSITDRSTVIGLESKLNILVKAQHNTPWTVLRNQIIETDFVPTRNNHSMCLRAS